MCKNVTVVIPTIPEREENVKRLKEIIKYPMIVVGGDKSLSAKRNEGGRQSTTDYILFLDDDNMITNESIKTAEMVMNANAAVGVIGLLGFHAKNPTRVCDGGSIRSYQTGFCVDGYEKGKCDAYPVSEVCNAFMVRKSLFDKLEFDEKNFPIELDEADFCYRVWKSGYWVIMLKKSFVLHDSFTSSRIPNFRRKKSAYFMGRNKIIFQKKHGLPLRWIPLHIIAYLACLLRNPKMILPFWKGVIDGYRKKL